MRNTPRVLPLLLALVVALVGAPTAHADSPADILKRAQAARDKPAMEQALKDIDAEVARVPADPAAHHARGLILDRLGRSAEALAEYDATLKLDPKAFEANYNAGLVLLDLRRVEEAIARFEATLQAEPRHADAAFNLGQARYNRKEYPQALAAWTLARTHAPNDFDLHKKILQAQHALGQHTEAKATRTALLALWNGSQDPRLRQLKDFVFDQFDVVGWHVYAAETFVQTGDLAYIYVFRVAGPDDKVVGSINLETSKVIQELGTPYVFGVDKRGAHKTLNITFKELPDYPTLKPIVAKLVEAEFGKAK